MMGFPGGHAPLNLRPPGAPMAAAVAAALDTPSPAPCPLPAPRARSRLPRALHPAICPPRNLLRCSCSRRGHAARRPSHAFPTWHYPGRQRQQRAQHGGFGIPPHAAAIWIIGSCCCRRQRPHHRPIPGCLAGRSRVCIQRRAGGSAAGRGHAGHEHPRPRQYGRADIPWYTWAGVGRGQLRRCRPCRGRIVQAGGNDHCRGAGGAAAAGAGAGGGLEPAARGRQRRQLERSLLQLQLEKQPSPSPGGRGAGPTGHRAHSGRPRRCRPARTCLWPGADAAVADLWFQPPQPPAATAAGVGRAAPTTMCDGAGGAAQEPRGAP